MTTFYLIMILTSAYSSSVAPVPFASWKLCDQAGQMFVAAKDGMLTTARYICVEAGDLHRS